MSRVLVKTHCFLGDFICSEPALRAICKKHHNDEIIVQSVFGDFLKWYPYTIRIVSKPEPADIEYKLICDGNSNLVTKVAELNQLTISDLIPDLNIPIQTSHKEPYYVICAEASTKERHWSEDNWESLVDRLDAPVIQVGKWNKVQIKNADTSMLGKVLLPDELATLIFHAKSFITVDTGLSHFAASIKKPYIVLMDKVPISWRNHCGYTISIHKHDIKKITVEDVLFATTQYIGKHD